MVSSMTKKSISLAISLLVAVISLIGVVRDASALTATALTRYTPGFVGEPGKMTRDGAGNFYVTDFWGKGIVKLNKDGSRAGFIATSGRPTAVAVAKDGRLVVAMAVPQSTVAFYTQIGTSPNVTGEQSGVFTGASPAFYRPCGVAVDATGKIYVLDSGDSSNSTTVNVPKVHVFDTAGSWLFSFGNRTPTTANSTVGGEFKQPSGIVYEPVNNRIIVADTLNGRLQLFSAYDGSTCTYLSSVGSAAGVQGGVPDDTFPVLFGDPTDVAMEYSGSTVSRYYVTERARYEIAVVNATDSTQITRIKGTNYPGTDMVLPTGIAFEKTPTGSGILYVTSAATATTAANVLPMSIDSGALAAGPSLTMSDVPDTSSASPISLGGTVGGVAVTCAVNGVDYPATGTANWSVSNVSLTTGLNTIVCRASNASGTSYVSDWTVYAPSLQPAPTIAIAQPSAGAFIKNASVLVSGTSDTANATVQVVNSSNSYTVTTTTGPSKTWSATINLVDGNNPITVSAWKAGTNTGTDNVTVNYDRFAPGLSVASLHNATTTNAVQNFDGVVTEPNLDKIEVNGVVVTTAAKVDLGSNKTYFSAPVTLQRGSNSISVKAYDLAGNVTEAVRSVTLNPEIPGLAVSLPADNSSVFGTASAASGTVATSFASVNAAGVNLTPAGGLWSTGSFPVASGVNAYLFTASGNGNQAVTEKRTILSDAAYAQLAIVSPAADQATNASSIVVKVDNGTAVAPTSFVVSGGATVTAGPTYSGVDGTFSYTISLPSQGGYSIKVTSGSSTVVRNIIKDTTLPEITLQADSKPMPATITGTIEPSAKLASVTAMLNSAPITIPISVVSFNPVANGTVVWRAALNGYPYDADSLTFTTVDPAGNEKQLAYVNFIPTGDVDNDGVVRLSDALAALRHVAGTQALSGTAFKQADVGSLVEGRAGRDGVVDISDSVLILNKSYGLMTF